MPAAALPHPVGAPRGRRPNAHSTPRPRELDHGIVGQLNAEWRRVAEHQLPATTATRWGCADPTLRHLDCLADVEQAHRRDGDRVLAALVLLAQRGDSLAGQAAVRLMLGGAVALAGRLRCRAAAEPARQQVLAALWQAIHRYPTARPASHVADRLILDTLRLTLREMELDQVIAQHERDADLDGLPSPAERLAEDQRVLGLLNWASDHGALDPDEVLLLLHLHLPADPTSTPTGREVAAAAGLTHAALRQRASRAKRRLRQAAAEATTARDATIAALSA